MRIGTTVVVHGSTTRNGRTINLDDVTVSGCVGGGGSRNSELSANYEQIAIRDISLTVVRLGVLSCSKGGTNLNHLDQFDHAVSGTVRCINSVLVGGAQTVQFSTGNLSRNLLPITGTGDVLGVAILGASNRSGKLNQQQRGSHWA